MFKKKNIDLRNNNNNEKISDPVSIANMFNIFFKNAPSEILKKINVLNNDEPVFTFRVENNFALCPYTEDELGELLLKRLKNSRSCGFDEVPNFLIREVLPYIIGPLTYLVNLSFCCGEFPSRLKMGNVLFLSLRRETCKILKIIGQLLYHRFFPRFLNTPF